MRLIKKSTFILFFILIALVLGGTSLRYLLLKYGGTTTVGTTTEITYGGQSAKYINYIFKVEDKIYKGKRNIWSDKVKAVDGHYAIVYYKKWPIINTILTDHQLDDQEFGSNLDSLIDLAAVKIGFWTL